MKMTHQNRNRFNTTTSKTKGHPERTFECIYRGYYMVGAVSPPVSTPELPYRHETEGRVTLRGEGVDTGVDTAPTML